MSTSTFAGRSLFGRTRSSLLAVLYGHTDQSFYSAPNWSGSSCRPRRFQRELKHLTDMGLNCASGSGNQFSTERFAEPILSEIKSLITKTVAFTRCHPFCFGVFGVGDSNCLCLRSVHVKGGKRASGRRSDGFGNALFSDVVSILGSAQRALGREINPTVFPVSEFRSKMRQGTIFLA